MANSAIKFRDTLSKARKEIQSVEDSSVEVVPGYNFNYLQTLNKIDLYFASRFLKGQYDSEGFKKLFIQIAKYRVNTATKSVNIGTKDVQVRGVGENYYPAWFFEYELKEFMRDNGWGKLFNDICTKWPRYGSIITKDVNGNPVLMRLRNMIWDMTQPDLMRSPFIDERHIYTYDEFYNEGIKNQWANLEEVMEMYEKAKMEEIQVIERYGFVPGDELTDNPGNPSELVKARTIIAGLEFHDADLQSRNRKKLTQKAEILQALEIEKPPYRKLDWEEEDGRGLGVGVMEDLFQHQEYHNDVTHLERKSLHWSSKKFFQTRDPEAPSNLYSQARNGDVFQLKSELSPVAMEERNLPQYNLVFNRIKESADNNSFSHEIVTGEGLASGTPFRLGALLSNAVNTHYAFKRENLGIYIENLVWDFVVPQFKKEKRAAHIFSFNGDREQLEQVRDYLVNAYMDSMVRKHFKKTGKYPTLTAFDRELERIQGRLDKQDSVSMELPENFYENIDRLRAKLKVDVSGQDVNSVDLETLGNIFKIIAENPGVEQNPTAMRLLEQIANEAGQNPRKLFGVGKPAVPPAPAVAPAGPAQPNAMAEAIATAAQGGQA